VESATLKGSRGMTMMIPSQQKEGQWNFLGKKIKKLKILNILRL
jgi:hypothetical protein